LSAAQIVVALCQRYEMGKTNFLAMSLAAMAMLMASPIAIQSDAHAGRSWSLGGVISQTYKRSNWSGAAQLGAPAGKPSYATKKNVYGVSKKKKAKAKTKSKGIWKKKSLAKKKKAWKKVASINKTYDVPPLAKKSLTGGGVRWIASKGCLNARLKSIVHTIAANYGRVTVSSTCRSRKHNRRVGGAKRSQHLTGAAVDFRVHGRYGAAWAYIKKASGVGGYKHYGGGLFHVDVGARRTW